LEAPEVFNSLLHDFLAAIPTASVVEE